ncbi:protein shisa-5-like [Saccostrea echinata]|uniref:protein shisa-5-like n=1 Tax=Saccostrea echinata TaxID=191078 RepID=UPI002A812397|nr:protein shisa-5-like [Saccostrea echinata]
MTMRDLRNILNFFCFLVGIFTVEAQGYYSNYYYSYYKYTSNSTSTSYSAQNYNTLIYIGAIIGGLVCIVAIVIIVVACICCRRKQGAAGTVIHSTSNPTNVVFNTSQSEQHFHGSHPHQPTFQGHQQNTSQLQSQPLSQGFHSQQPLQLSAGNISPSPSPNDSFPPPYSKDPPPQMLNRATPSAPSLQDLDK